MPQLAGQGMFNVFWQGSAGQYSRLSRHHPSPAPAHNAVRLYPPSRLHPFPNHAWGYLRISQLTPSVIANVVSIITAFLGSYFSDRTGRRPALIFGSIALAATYGAAMVASSQTGVKSYVEIEPAPNPVASRAGIAFLILAQGVYGYAIATNVWTYPSEVLSTRQRSTAMSLASLTTKLSCTCFSAPQFRLLAARVRVAA